jgi:GT2 family glycosyltransferase
LLPTAVCRFSQEPDLAVIALRIVDEDGTTARRHLSGLRQRPNQKSDVTSFPGGGTIIRRKVFDELDGLCEAFTYALEETDLAWRVIDHGHRISYDPSLTMFHPRTLPSRHHDFARRTARNRVWLAHRRLPLFLAWIYPLNWLLITTIRNWRSPTAVKAAFAGTLDGLRLRPGPRHPMGWETVIRLARLGRPPII